MRFLPSQSLPTRLPLPLTSAFEENVISPIEQMGKRRLSEEMAKAKQKRKASLWQNGAQVPPP